MLPRCPVEDVAAHQGMFLAGRDGQHTMQRRQGCLVELQQLMNEPPLLHYITIYLHISQTQTKSAFLLYTCTYMCTLVHKYIHLYI